MHTDALGMPKSVGAVGGRKLLNKGKGRNGYELQIGKLSMRLRPSFDTRHPAVTLPFELYVGMENYAGKLRRGSYDARH